MVSANNEMEEKIIDLASKLVESPSIMGSYKYFHSAVLIPILKLQGQYYFLFQKRATGIRQGGEICFPGGKVDPSLDSNFQETAIRETEEEIGIGRDKIRVVGQLDTLVAAMGAIVYPFVAILDINSLDEIKINPDEVEEAFVILVEYFKDNPPEEHKVRLEIQPSFYSEKDGKVQTLFPAKKFDLPERYHKSWGGKIYPVYVYQPPEGVIWGITAELIRELMLRI